MRFPIFTVFVALCSWLINGCSEDVTRRTGATVFSLTGDVVFGTAEGNNFEPVTLRSRIYDGSIVRTSDGALLDLGLNAGALARIAGNSEIQIEELNISKDGNQTRGGVRSRSARVRVNRGKIIVLFSERGEGASQFAISAPTVTVTADSDCLFSVQRDDAATRVTCARGKVYAAGGERPPLAIDSGYFQQWPLTRPAPVAASENAAAQVEITDSLQAEDKLLKMDADWQNRHPL
jgi:hypothetical protein